jgi:hypothetical protein
MTKENPSCILPFDKLRVSGVLRGNEKSKLTGYKLELNAKLSVHYG